MNTAGSVLQGKGLVDDTFAVVMGDHLTNVNIKAMAKSHKESKAR